MKFIAIGDVHGNVVHCDNVCRKNPNHTIIQIGDLGVGFMPLSNFKLLPKNFRFFVGNHDCRKIANKLESCLGDFGEHNGFFFVSGADSIDKAWRTEGINWWADEEITHAQAQECLTQWENSKAEILLCHDLPQSIAESYYLIYDKTLTRNLLQSMIELRKPKLVIYGHHHKPKRFTEKGIEYVGLGIDETYEFST